MNKGDLVDALEGRLGGRKAASEALEAVLDVIIREVARGGKVGITGGMERVFYYPQPAGVQLEGFFADGIHPSEQGYADWAAAMMKYFGKTYEW